MQQKTKDYQMFIFRDDNRERINASHIKKLVESIKSNNLLGLRPILVNDKLEVIDGQHRLLAAKELGVEIYYKIVKGLDSEEIITMNIANPWIAADYLNFYCKNGYEDYIKLKDFIKDNEISLRVALSMLEGDSKKSRAQFKSGNFQFKNPPHQNELKFCHETIEYIKKINGFSIYTSSFRFWKALRTLVTHKNFDNRKWKENLSRMVERFQAKPTTEDYCRLMMDVYNWQNRNKVNLIKEDI